MSDIKPIGVDVRMLGFSGIGTYVRGLLEHFPEPAIKNIILFGQPLDVQIFEYRSIPSRDPIYSIREQIRLPRKYTDANLGLLHVPHYNIPWGYRGRMITTIHDLIHILFPKLLPNKIALYYAHFMMKSALKKSRFIIADSENTKQDILRTFKVSDDKIRVIYPGIHRMFFNQWSKEKIQATRKHYNLPQKYILYVGNLRLSKNIPRLIQAFRALRKKIDDIWGLVLVGRNSLPSSYWELNRADGVMVFENIPTADLPGIYQGASVFVFPSLYEGFGLPPLEAMASGIPVVSSTGGSLPEVLGDAACMIDPHDTEALSMSLEKILYDDQMRNSYIAKGSRRARLFSWDDAAKKHWNLYLEALQ
ncbi:MAG: glycosyltransferase, partial [Elusimicrobia bacterium]|nr:glycosyltransferase [Elusimicrobiota bacterium]MBD3411558.1 glycosyltransferase [Elusimicrobiota bacterium]